MDGTQAAQAVAGDGKRMQNGRPFRYRMLAATAGLGLILLACGSSSSTPESASAASTPEPASSGYWTDPTTKLTWAAKDNGYDVTWDMAKTFCTNLTTAGYKWQLPTIEQLETIYYVGENDFGHPVKGNIKLTGCCEWSSSPKGQGVAWLFNFNTWNRNANAVGYTPSTRALCVRHP